MAYSKSLILCVRGIHWLLVDSPHLGPVTLDFHVLFGVCWDKRLNKKWSCRWFETPWLWYNVTVMVHGTIPTCNANPKAIAYTSPAGIRKHAMASLMFGRIWNTSIGQNACITRGAANSVTGQNTRDKSVGKATMSRGSGELGNLLYRWITCKSWNESNSGGLDWCWPPEELSTFIQTWLAFDVLVVDFTDFVMPEGFIRDDMHNTNMAERDENWINTAIEWSRTVCTTNHLSKFESNACWVYFTKCCVLYSWFFTGLYMHMNNSSAIVTGLFRAR